MAGRRHHIVPRFYLRNFADHNKVKLVDRDDLTRSHLSSVVNAAVDAGFYRIEAEDLERVEDRKTFDPESIESALSTLEAEWAPAVSRLIDDEPYGVGSEIWYRVVQFAAVQSVRGHRWRNDLVAMATQTARIQVLQDLTDEEVRKELTKRGQPSKPDDIASWREHLAAHFPRLIPPQAVFVQESLKMALGNPDTGTRGITQYLAGKTLQLIHTRESSVLTSDEPVVWWAPGDEPVGYATAKIIWLPLSPRLIVQFREQDFDPTTCGLPGLDTTEGADEMARIVNQLVASQAERWIIHHPADGPLDGIRLPPREVWGDELVDVQEDGRTRRELWMHRRRRPS